MADQWLGRRNFGNHFIDVRTSLTMGNVPKVTAEMIAHDFCCDQMALLADDGFFVFHTSGKAGVMRFGYEPETSEEHEIRFCPFCGKALS